MSLGTGLFLAALALIIAWQVDKHHAWKKFLLGVLGLTGLAGLGIGVHFGKDYWTTYSRTRTEIAAIKNGKPDKYSGIGLGSAQAEVRYLKGEPDRKNEASDDTGAVWVYGAGAGEEIIVAYDKKGNVDEVVCEGKYASECDGFAGVKIGDSEESVLRVLGPAVGPVKFADSGAKILHFGADESHWVFGVSLYQSKVKALFITRAEEPT